MTVWVKNESFFRFIIGLKFLLLLKLQIHHELINFLDERTELKTRTHFAAEVFE